MESADQELMARMATGDEAAFAALFDRYAPRVFGLLLQLLRNRGDAEDILQVTFWEAWRRAPQYDPARSRPEVWLLLIARSRALDHLRRRRAERAETAEVEQAITYDPSAGLLGSEQNQLVEEALARLPEEQGSAIRLAFFGGLTHEQIAQRQGIPLGTVKTRIRLGMNRLRETLAERRQPVAEP